MQEHMHTFLFVGGVKDKRETSLQDYMDRWHIVPVDIIRLAAEGEHITIDEVRDFQKRLLLAPMQSPYTVGVIQDASLLTIEAQQALLKLLEEPPPRAYILLETDSADQLLPTIVSRCQIIRLSADSESDAELVTATQTINSLMGDGAGEVFALVDAHTGDRTEAKQWVRTLLSAARVILLSRYQKNTSTDSNKIVRFIRRLQKAQTQLAVNCNPKLVLDRVFLSL